MKMQRIFLAVAFALAVLQPATSLHAEQTHTGFNLQEEDEIVKPQRGNLFNLVFGAAPPRATERGILVIDAFHDRNGDGRRDSGEDELDREIFCLVDGIEYDVPAFIPGLAFQGSYKVLCAGDRYVPALKKEEIFVERRGEIIRILLPCRAEASGSASRIP